MKIKKFIFLVIGYWLLVNFCYAQDIKQPNVAGSFYPANPQELSLIIDNFIHKAEPETIDGQIFALISPHAGYEFSGQVAAYGYKLIRNIPYKTVVIIGPSHYHRFEGVSVYAKGVFKTPLGDLEVDQDFTGKILNKAQNIFFEPRAFQREHSIEVQLPFLQKVLSGFKIVPIAMGDCSLSTCQKLADLLKEAIGNRKDVLVVASTDMYHGYDYQEAQIVDNLTFSYLKKMDAEGLYSGLREGKLQLCGGFPVVSCLILAKELGHNKLNVLKHTNSAEVTGKKIKGIWIVGYSSCVIDASTALSVNGESFDVAQDVIRQAHDHSNDREQSRTASKDAELVEARSRTIDQEKGEVAMLNKEQRKRLLEIARSSIETYLKTGKKLEVAEKDSVLLKEMGSFVTLHKAGQLRGCIGNLVGQQPLYLTVRDMAVEAAVDDPRFPAVELEELKNIEIEISALSPLQRVDSADKIQMGIHGVLIKKGFSSGVFLPQVATETGWSKEEFLSNLCSHKAGLSSNAWKDKSTELYIFTAEVFSEKNY